MRGRCLFCVLELGARLEAAKAAKPNDSAALSGGAIVARIAGVTPAAGLKEHQDGPCFRPAQDATAHDEAGSSSQRVCPDVVCPSHGVPGFELRTS